MCNFHWPFAAFYFMVLLVSLGYQGVASAAEGCGQLPSYRCLLIKADQILDQQYAVANAVRDQLIFEAELEGMTSQLGTLTPSKEFSENRDKLALEEQFIKHLKQKKFSKAESMLPNLAGQLTDASANWPHTLLIQHLTLALQDQSANRIKKAFYEKRLEQKPHWQADAVLSVARHEILGGAPGRGKTTLDNTSVNAFSAADIVLQQETLQLLIDPASELFLNPAQTDAQCQHQTEQHSGAINAFFHQATLERLRKIHNIANPKVANQTQLDLAQLYRNAKYCPLFATLIEYQLVDQQLNQTYNRDEAALYLIFLARSLRRYHTK